MAYWPCRPSSTAHKTVLYSADEGLHDRNVIQSAVSFYWYIRYCSLSICLHVNSNLCCADIKVIWKKHLSALAFKGSVMVTFQQWRKLFGRPSMRLLSEWVILAWISYLFILCTGKCVSRCVKIYQQPSSNSGPILFCRVSATWAIYPGCNPSSLIPLCSSHRCAALCVHLGCASRLVVRTWRDRGSYLAPSAPGLWVHATCESLKLYSLSPPHTHTHTHSYV